MKGGGSVTINNALAALKLPVTHPPYKGEANEYITYQHITQSTTLYAEGIEAETSVLYSVDLYTDTPPFAERIQEIKRLLAAADWSCVVDAEMYETETGMYHIAMSAQHVGGIYG